MDFVYLARQVLDILLFEMRYNRVLRDLSWNNQSVPCPGWTSELCFLALFHNKSGTVQSISLIKFDDDGDDDDVKQRVSFSDLLTVKPFSNWQMCLKL